MHRAISRITSYSAVAIVVGLLAPGPLSTFAHAASPPPPQLCTSEEEQDVAANAARCHAQRAASALYRTREAVEYAEKRQEDSVKDKEGTASIIEQMKGLVPAAEKWANKAKESAEANNAKNAALSASSAAGVALNAANSTAALLGGYGKVPNTMGDTDLPPIYFGQHGKAGSAAATASSWAGAASDIVHKSGLMAEANVAADKAETDAIAAYKAAEWINP
ncbi:hypothetical protein [Nocardia sp. XZ_19_369]|uniref:hypothetical protein n=1 Tax=Nocardia sp. XZ_19_369 TaxID=2769487 RepID=UPI00188E0BD7|nr:hypothetical protein [Nocardia sp. XZ_19_369]